LLKGGRDADPRQQTLRATIEWSYDLLIGDEKQLFARLAAFTGGCTLDAAENVCDAELDLLQSLVEKSLLRHTGGRFWMLETIREFAVERLQSLAEAGQMGERHARWYLRFAERGREALRSAGQEEWLVRLDHELENLRSAIAWARGNDGQLEVELAGATWYFLALRGLFRESLTYIRRALETARREPALDQAELLYGAGYTALRIGDLKAAERWSEQRLALGRARGDGPVIARSLLMVGLVAEVQGELERAATLHLEAAEAARACGDTLTPALAALNLGNIALRRGNAKAARTHFQQALALHHEQSNTGGEANALVCLSQAALAEDDTNEAAALLDSALRLESALGDREVIFACLLGSAEVAVRRGETARAARLLQQLTRLAERPVTPPIRSRTSSARGSRHSSTGTTRSWSQPSPRDAPLRSTKPSPVPSATSDRLTS
jgi:tetratricopeptide (TPR) repeat protein